MIARETIERPLDQVFDVLVQEVDDATAAAPSSNSPAGEAGLALTRFVTYYRVDLLMEDGEEVPIAQSTDTYREPYEELRDRIKRFLAG